jgi:topoisomerase-4 subunit A
MADETPKGPDSLLPTPPPLPATLEDSSIDESIGELFAVNFLEYASYVIKDRAIPDIDDGLKPVQRRILHSLYQFDDGRFHKVANVIGHTMQFHPHGDMSIGSALVVLANKEYFIERQGNFGNIYTGDQASASRYIECRLTPLAREVLFNPEITETVPSYDGRHMEPVTLPAKVPALLMLGSDGIAVGMSTRILPHNFAELLQAQIAILEDRPFRLYPDFLTGGYMDVSDYEDGLGRVKVRALIEAVDEKTIVIREVPYGTTTEGLITSIEDATRKGKIKIASIHDYTAEKPEIEIKLQRGIYAAETIPQLFIHTDCEVNISSRLIVIREDRPVEISVSDVLRHNTNRLVAYLKWELEIELGKLHERFHEKTLAQIFIENRIYKRIEECETYQDVITEVQTGLEPFLELLRRDVTEEDIQKLLQIQIRRISLFDINKNRQELEDILAKIAEAERNLADLIGFTIRYIRDLLKRYGRGFPRRTKIDELQEIDAREVALDNIRVGHDRVKQFVGSEVRNSNKGEEPIICNEYDRLVLIRKDGAFQVIPIPEKQYVGPIKYLLKEDREQIYSLVYKDKKTRKVYAKRCRINRYVMNRDYQMAPNGCVIEYLTTNHGVVLRLDYVPNPRFSEDHVVVDFAEIDLRTVSARGFRVGKHPVDSISVVKRGSTDGPEDEAQEQQEEATPGEPTEEQPHERSAAEDGEQDRNDDHESGEDNGDWGGDDDEGGEGDDEGGEGADDEDDDGDEGGEGDDDEGGEGDDDEDDEDDDDEGGEGDDDEGDEGDGGDSDTDSGTEREDGGGEPELNEAGSPPPDSGPPAEQRSEESAGETARAWRERTTAANRVPHATEPHLQEEGESGSAGDDTAPRPARRTPPKRIDEETPFFLE